MAESAMVPSFAAAGELRRRRALPNGRAVVGGLLVTASTVGMFVAWSMATAEPTTRYVVASRDLAPGTRLAAADLRLEAMELPDGLAAEGAFRDPGMLVGAAVVGPIRGGELVQGGSITGAENAPDALELSFALEASRALGGRLEPGEVVDVVATFGAGGETYTTTVVAGAQVLHADGGETVTIALAVSTGDDARAIAHAVNAGEVLLVRSNAKPADVDRTGTYRAPSASAREEGAP